MDLQSISPFQQHCHHKDSIGPAKKVRLQYGCLYVELYANFRAMATEAETTREAKSKVIAAEGERKACFALKAAADMIGRSPVALQLRHLQTMRLISAKNNSTIVLPIPTNVLGWLSKKNKET